MKILKHKFVEQIPEEPEEGVLYVSIPFETVIHKCCCGCGNEVVTPLSPTDWSLTFDGETITLNPSIGNWNFKCKSHYFIRKNRVEWSRSYTKKEIEKVKKIDLKDKLEFLNDCKLTDLEIKESIEFKSPKFTFFSWWKSLFKKISN